MPLTPGTTLGPYRISAAPIGGGSVTRLLDSASTGVYDSGRLLFMRAEKLFAPPFDPATLALSGDPEIVGDRIWNDGVATAGLVGFDAAAGVLALRPAVSDRTRIAWRDVSGKTLGELPGDGAVEAVPTRDGRLVILVRPDGQSNSLGYTILDAARGTTVPFTAPDATSTSPVWSPDNRRIVYSSVRDGAFDLFIREVKPGGADTRLLHTDGMKAAQSWSPDGRILFTAIDAQTRLDIWAIDAIPGAKPKLFAGGAGDQCCGRFSPDGKWVAYTASETGRPEVFIKPFTGDGDAVQVSVNGGGAAEWNGNGSEIFYLTPDNRLISVPVTLSGDRAIVGQPTPHFPIHSRIRPAVRMLVTDNRIFATAGDRLLVTETMGDSSSSTINLLLNWTAPPGAGR